MLISRDLTWTLGLGSAWALEPPEGGQEMAFEPRYMPLYDRYREADTGHGQGTMGTAWMKGPTRGGQTGCGSMG